MRLFAITLSKETWNFNWKKEMHRSKSYSLVLPLKSETMKICKINLLAPTLQALRYYFFLKILCSGHVILYVIRYVVLVSHIGVHYLGSIVSFGCTP